jgi:excisionase family DNA binding protein
MEKFMDKNKTGRLSVTVEEAAKAIGISRSSMYAEIKRGRIRTFKIAGRILIPWTELTSLIDRAREESDSTYLAALDAVGKADGDKI